MDWFKHFNDAGEGTFLSSAMEEFGHQGYAVYFLLIELCMTKFEENPTAIFRFHKRKLKDKLRISYTKVEVLLNFFQGFDQLSFKKDKDIFEIEFPKLRLILNRDSRMARQKRVTVAPVAPLDKDKDKDKDIYKKPDMSLFEKVIKYWDDKKIEKQETHDFDRPHVIRALRGMNLSFEQITAAIDNYHALFTGEQYLYSWEFSLVDFLTKDIATKFYHPQFNKNKYLKPTSHQTNDNPYSKEAEELHGKVLNLGSSNTANGVLNEREMEVVRRLPGQRKFILSANPQFKNLTLKKIRETFIELDQLNVVPLKKENA